MDPISGVVLDWLCGALLTAGQQRLAGLLGTDKQRGELVRITRAATRLAVADVVNARDQDVIADALLREGPGSVLPDTGDGVSLRDRMVAGSSAPGSPSSRNRAMTSTPSGCRRCSPRGSPPESRRTRACCGRPWAHFWTCGSC